MAERVSSPAYKSNGFQCPHCGVVAQQEWSVAVMISPQNPFTAQIRQNLPMTGYDFSYCTVCGAPSFWVRRNLVWPQTLVAPAPAGDFPEDVKLDYDEARNIFGGSPRASAALLRLAIQKLCVHLGQNGANLNHDIGELVKAGLPVKIQQALDIVRVIGNNAVHPGEIRVDDDPKIASNLFYLVNVIVENMITQPRKIAENFGALPDRAREQIARRDKLTDSQTAPQEI